MLETIVILASWALLAAIAAFFAFLLLAGAYATVMDGWDALTGRNADARAARKRAARPTDWIALLSASIVFGGMLVLLRQGAPDYPVQTGLVAAFVAVTAYQLMRR